MKLHHWVAQACGVTAALSGATAAAAASYVQYQVAVDGFQLGFREPGSFDYANYGPVAKFTDTWTILAEQAGQSIAVVDGACGAFSSCDGFVSASGFTVRAASAQTTETMTLVFAGSTTSPGGLPLFDLAGLSSASYAQTIGSCPTVTCAKTSSAVRFLGSTELATSAPLTPGVTLASVATPLPEPATWTTLIAGFGAIGGALRRRRRTVTRRART